MKTGGCALTLTAGLAFAWARNRVRPFGIEDKVKAGDSVQRHG
jgi:hypothetical protein